MSGAPDERARWSRVAVTALIQGVRLYGGLVPGSLEWDAENTRTLQVGAVLISASYIGHGERFPRLVMRVDGKRVSVAQAYRVALAEAGR